ncbi:MAG TPA: endolytic transglycosylase MltG [Conexibacter sp.]|nr:endolytic transglycosylase MltG [Conexibacter sp.]
MSRTPEEREAARLERERKRAAREGRPLPSEPAPTPPPAPDARRSPPAEQVEDVALPSEPAHDPQPTQMFDVTTQWTGEHAAVPAAAESEPLDAPEPGPAFEPAAAPEPTPAAPTLTLEPEVPLGTRRVRPHERSAAATVPKRGRGAKPPAPPAPPRGGAGGRGGSAPRSGRPRWGLRIGALLALALVVLAGWFLWSIYQPGAGEGSGRVVVKVPSGASVGEIGDLLASRGVIDSSFYFKLRAKVSGSSSELKSGTFTLKNDMSYGAALDALSKTPPPPPVVRITIPEGRSRREIVPLVRQAGLRGDYLAASRSSRELDPGRYGAPKGAALEGFLFPATYELRRGATARQLVAQQALAFRQNLAKVNLRYARSKNLTVFDVLTIAAMVEREVAVARERPLVAAVIYNRLKDGMNLGIDATLRFELNDWTSPLKVSELQAPTPYNTRLNPGLPPGPIGNPGLASIEAAAHPAKVPYLFYVVKPGTCSEHAFSSTDAQFEQDVQRYNDARNAAGGKSPTTC